MNSVNYTYYTQSSLSALIKWHLMKNISLLVFLILMLVNTKENTYFLFKEPVFTIDNCSQLGLFYPQGNLVMSRNIFGCHKLKVILLVGRDYKYIPQYTGQLPTPRIIQSKMSIRARLINPTIEISFVILWAMTAVS